MALTNCTINSASVNVTQGQALGSTANQVLTITPNTGYRVAASDFTNNTGSLVSGPIQSITLTNSGNAYAAGNTVLVTVDLKNSFVANSNTNSVIDIDGSALAEKLIPYTWDGNRIVSGTNVQNAGTTSITQQTGSAGESKTVDNFTLQASSGHYFAEEPGDPVVSGSYSSSHTIENSSIVTDSSSRITAKNYTVSYVFPTASTTGNNITYSGTARAIPTEVDEINAVNTNTGVINSTGETRSINVFGTKTTSKFTITITRGNGNTYDFTTDTFTSASTNSGTITIGSEFNISKVIEIPANASGDTYSVKVAAVSPTVMSSTVNNYNNSNPTFTWTQSAPAIFSVTGNSAAQTFTKTHVNNTLNISLNLEEQEGPLYNLANMQITATHASKNLYLRRQPVFSNSTAYNTSGTNDFTNTIASSNNGTDFTIQGLAAVGSGTQTITVSASDIEIHSTGTSGVSSVLNLDNIINQAPVTSTSSFTAAASGATTHGLTASDPNNDTLSYIVVTAPSKGTLSIASNGVATYTRNVGQSGTDLFRFKVNDSFEDSNTSTVNVTLGSSSVFSYNTVYKYRDSSHPTNSTVEYNLSAVFSGSLVATNFVAGSSNDLTLKVQNWSLDATHAGIPTYMNDKYDYDEVFYRLKNGSNTVINHGQIPINYSTSTFNNSARTGTVQTNVLDTNTNNLASEAHTLEIVIIYKNNATP